MSQITKFLSKSGVASIALFMSVALGTDPVQAQTCESSGEAVGHTSKILAAIAAAQTAIDTTITADFTTFIGPGTGGCLTLQQCLQTYFAQLGQTLTNNQLMQSSINSKAEDHNAANAFGLTLQGEQSRQAIANGQGTSASSNSLQYLNNSLCVPATISTGAAQATVGTNTVIVAQATIPRSGGAPNLTGVSANPPSPTEALTPKTSNVTRMTEYFSAAKPFASADGTSSKSGTTLSMAGSCPDAIDIFGLDTAPDRLLCQLSWSDPNLNKADNLYVNYILGIAPEVPPFTPGAANTPLNGQQASVADREKVAFMTTAQLGFKDEYALRQPFTNAANASIQAIYGAVGQGTGAVGGNSSLTSKAQLLDALFRQPVENPNSFVNLASLGVAEKALQFIAGKMMLSNYLNYERYLVERKVLDVNSAQLAIAYRGYNFQSQP